jgi:hypothetical protein
MFIEYVGRKIIYFKNYTLFNRQQKQGSYFLMFRIQGPLFHIKTKFTHSHAIINEMLYTVYTWDTHTHTCWCAENAITLVAWVAYAYCFASCLIVSASSMNITNVNLQTGYIYTTATNNSNNNDNKYDGGGGDNYSNRLHSTDY